MVLLVEEGRKGEGDGRGRRLQGRGRSDEGGASPRPRARAFGGARERPSPQPVRLTRMRPPPAVKISMRSSHASLRTLAQWGALTSKIDSRMKRSSVSSTSWRWVVIGRCVRGGGYVMYRGRRKEKGRGPGESVCKGIERAGEGRVVRAL